MAEVKTISQDVQFSSSVGKENVQIDTKPKRGGKTGRGRQKSASESATTNIVLPTAEPVKVGRGGKTARGRGRGRGATNSRTTSVTEPIGIDRKLLAQMTDSDIYEFHEDSGEETKNSGDNRSKLMLANKGQPIGDQPLQMQIIHKQESIHPIVFIPPIVNPSQPQATQSVATPSTIVIPTTAVPVQIPTVSNVVHVGEPDHQLSQQPQSRSPQVVLPSSPVDSIEASSPDDSNSSGNQRKSRRLQERDGRSTIDDTIEDVVKNLSTSPKASQVPSADQTPPRRSTRNAQISSSNVTVTQEKTIDSRKSPRANRRNNGKETVRTHEESDRYMEEIEKVATEGSRQPEEIATSSTIKRPPIKKQPANAPMYVPLSNEQFGGSKSLSSEKIIMVGNQIMVEAGPPHQKDDKESATNVIDPMTGELTLVRSSVLDGNSAPQSIMSISKNGVPIVTSTARPPPPLPAQLSNIVSGATVITSQIGPISVSKITAPSAYTPTSSHQQQIIVTQSSIDSKIPPQQHQPPSSVPPATVHRVMTNSPIPTQQGIKAAPPSVINIQASGNLVKVGNPNTRIVTQNNPIGQPQSGHIQNINQPMQAIHQVQPSVVIQNSPVIIQSNVIKGKPIDIAEAGRPTSSPIGGTIIHPPQQMQAQSPATPIKVVHPPQSQHHQQPIHLQKVSDGSIIQSGKVIQQQHVTTLQQPQSSMIIQQTPHTIQISKHSVGPIQGSQLAQLPPHLQATPIGQASGKNVAAISVVSKTVVPSATIHQHPIGQFIPGSGSIQSQEVVAAHIPQNKYVANLKMSDTPVSAHQASHPVSATVLHVKSPAPRSQTPPMNVHSQMPPQQQILPPNAKNIIGLHQNPQILTGAVASPPLKQPHLASQQPIVAGNNN